eukprot:1502928-Rhodomonas_salina.1
MQYNRLSWLSLADIGIIEAPGQPGVSATLVAWMLMGSATLSSLDSDPLQAMRKLTEADRVHNIGLLEPDPKHYRKALQHPWLAPLWRESAEEEMTCLMSRGCFRKWQMRDLTPEQRKCVYCSRFHHKIKLNTSTGVTKSLKTHLVVMGNQMKKGEAYVDAFAPVPLSTAGRIMMSIAAAQDLEMHCIDFSRLSSRPTGPHCPKRHLSSSFDPPLGGTRSPEWST